MGTVGRDTSQICFSVLVVCFLVRFPDPLVWVGEPDYVFPIYSLQSWREVETGAMVGGGLAVEGMEQRNHKKMGLAKSSQASPEHGLVKLQVADGRASSCIFVLVFCLLWARIGENAAGRHQPPVYLYIFVFVFVFVNTVHWTVSSEVVKLDLADRYPVHHFLRNLSSHPSQWPYKWKPEPKAETISWATHTNQFLSLGYM